MYREICTLHLAGNMLIDKDAVLRYAHAAARHAKATVELIKARLEEDAAARAEGRAGDVGAQSKERKGSNFAAQRSGAIVQKPEGPNTYDSKNLAIAIWQPCFTPLSLDLPHSQCGINLDTVINSVNGLAYRFYFGPGPLMLLCDPPLMATWTQSLMEKGFDRTSANNARHFC